MALSISASVGRFTFASSAAALMIWPDWQYPHCGTSFATQASCSTLPSLVWPIPSMVVILLPAAALTGVEQDRAGWPFTCTVQAPHNAMPQPYLVPVMPRWSRRTHRRGVSGSASTDTPLPLTFRVVIEKFLRENPRCYFLPCGRRCVGGCALNGAASERKLRARYECFRQARATKPRAQNRS